jgi:hypothetical protein
VAAAAYFLIHQITQVKDLPAVLARLDWSWAILALVASALTYVGAGLNLIGGFVQRLSLGLTTAVQLGGSFINRITPVKVGGMAVNVRYLQKQGLDSATAIGGGGDRRAGGRDHADRPDRRVRRLGWVQGTCRQAALQQHDPARPGRRGHSHWPGCWWSDRPGDSSAPWWSRR